MGAPRAKQPLPAMGHSSNSDTPSQVGLILSPHQLFRLIYDQDTTPNSTRNPSDDLLSEASSQSSATTPDLEPPITGSKKRNTVLHTLEPVPRSKPSAAKEGEREFVENLGNYIPLGSLTLRPSIGRAYLHQTRWTESSDTRSWLTFHDYCDQDTHPALFARILANSNWVRVFARKHQRYIPFQNKYFQCSRPLRVTSHNLGADSLSV